MIHSHALQQTYLGALCCPLIAFANSPMMQSAAEVTHCGEAFSLSIHCLCKSYRLDVAFCLGVPDFRHYFMALLACELLWKNAPSVTQTEKKKKKKWCFKQKKRLTAAKVVFPLGEGVDAWRMLRAWDDLHWCGGCHVWGFVDETKCSPNWFNKTVLVRNRSNNPWPALNSIPLLIEFEGLLLSNSTRGQCCSCDHSWLLQVCACMHPPQPAQYAPIWNTAAFQTF